jgi:hypothetical protein
MTDRSIIFFKVDSDAVSAARRGWDSDPELTDIFNVLYSNNIEAKPSVAVTKTVSDKLADEFYISCRRYQGINPHNVASQLKKCRKVANVEIY